MELLQIPDQNDDQSSAIFEHILNEIRQVIKHNEHNEHFWHLRFLLAVICSKRPKEEFSLDEFSEGESNKMPGHSKQK